MKASHHSFYLMIISISIFLLSFHPTAMQEVTLSEERQLLNDCLSHYNKTEKQFYELSAKMKDIKFNLVLKIKFKNLQKKNLKVVAKINKIKVKIDLNNYTKNEIMQDLKELNETISKFEVKCHKVNHIYYQNEKTKDIIVNMIKVFLKTLLIIIIIALIIIGIVSFYVIKKQRQYHRLVEEPIHEDSEEVKNQHNHIIIKNDDNTERKNISDENTDNLKSSSRKKAKEEIKESEQIDSEKLDSDIQTKDISSENQMK